ncbi:MAG: glycosyltransferase family 2 protein [Gammaproteobacteria bacterium]|nr:glycosyltransferase family 2 protein [Gammaproteobacteria bacterium]
MSTPLVSIILPTYNGEAFLENQLDSIFEQSFKDFEIIVSDDGSSDSTTEIINTWKNRKNFRYSINQKNIGFIQNFCQAAKRAEGKYIVPCDQDDVWLPHKLQILIDSINDHLLIYSNSRLIDEQEQPLGKSLKESLKVNFISGNNHRAFYYANCVAAHTMMFHRDLLQYIDTLPETVFHDHWLAYVASRLGSIKALDDELVLYRRHGSSVTTTTKKKRFTGNLFSYLKAKADRQFERNQNKITKLRTFQAFNQKIAKPDSELDVLIEELSRFDEYFFNKQIFSILNRSKDDYFAISCKGKMKLMMEECFGRKFYQYIPMTF